MAMLGHFFYGTLTFSMVILDREDDPSWKCKEITLVWPEIWWHDQMMQCNIEVDHYLKWPRSPNDRIF